MNQPLLKYAPVVVDDSGGNASARFELDRRVVRLIAKRRTVKVNVKINSHAAFGEDVKMQSGYGLRRVPNAYKNRLYRSNR